LVSPVTIRTPARCAARGFHHALQVGQRQSFLEDKSEREIKRLRPAHREVVDRAIDGKIADIAAGKENRRHHI
jgi:hypothetical protein